MYGFLDKGFVIIWIWIKVSNEVFYIGNSFYFFVLVNVVFFKMVLFFEWCVVYSCE